MKLKSKNIGRPKGGGRHGKVKGNVRTGIIVYAGPGGTEEKGEGRRVHCVKGRVGEEHITEKWGCYSKILRQESESQIICALT